MVQKVDLLPRAFFRASFSGIILALREELKTQCNIYAKIALQSRQNQGMVMVWGIIVHGSCVIFQ